MYKTYFVSWEVRSSVSNEQGTLRTFVIGSGIFEVEADTSFEVYQIIFEKLKERNKSVIIDGRFLHIVSFNEV